MLLVQALHGLAGGMLHPLQHVWCRIDPWKGSGGDGGTKEAGMMGKLIRCQVPSRLRPAGSCLEGSALFSNQKRMATCRPPLRMAGALLTPDSALEVIWAKTTSQNPAKPHMGSLAEAEQCSEQVYQGLQGFYTLCLVCFRWICL